MEAYQPFATFSPLIHENAAVHPGFYSQAHGPVQYIYPRSTLTSSKNITETDDLRNSGHEMEPPTTAVVKHCRSCWRKELHRPVSIPPFAFGFLVIFTFGLVLFARPYECTCCGRTRIF